MGHEGHAHGHGHGHGGVALAGGARRRRVLWWVLGLNVAALAMEAVGGWVFGSLALLADAVHLLSDVAALGIALAAQALAARPGSARHTFGLRRAEVVGAQANGVLLVATAGWIVVEAVRRLGDSPEIAGGGLLVVAVIGLVVNVASARVLHVMGRGGGIGIRGAYLHMVSDAAGSVAAIAAGVAVVVADATWVDTVLSVAIAAAVVFAAWRLLRDATHLLLEAAPPGFDPAEIEGALAGLPDVEGVHHVHVWGLDSDTAALSAHVVVADDLRLHEAQLVGDRARRLLAERFGVTHATLELECHSCELPAGAEH